MSRIEPSLEPRLEFFITDAAGVAVPSLTHADVTSAAYVLITAGVRAAAATVTLTSSVAATAAISAGQFVTINSVRGHYAVDCAAGAALSTADSVELEVVMVDGTQLTFPVSHAIDVAVSTRASQTSLNVVDTEVGNLSEMISSVGITISGSGTGIIFNVSSSTPPPSGAFEGWILKFTEGPNKNCTHRIVSTTIVSDGFSKYTVTAVLDSPLIAVPGGSNVLSLYPDRAVTATDVNAQVLDVLSVDTFPEEASVPPSTTSILKKINWIYMWLRNKSTETATERKLYADDTTTVVSTEAVSDDGTTFTKGEQS